MTRIDVGSVLRNSANVPYGDLVTRPTGAAVRRIIERELASMHEGDVATLDFTHIGMMDYSCADEVVAKLLLAFDSPDARSGSVIFHGITDAHLEAIEVVLHHHGLALVVQFADGGTRLVGAVSHQERDAWEAVLARGALGAEEVATVVGGDRAASARVLDALVRRRLLRHDGTAYFPPGAVR